MSEPWITDKWQNATAEEWERERLKLERRIEQQKELEYIRAFVERVRARAATIDDESALDLALIGELAAMERENE